MNVLSLFDGISCGLVALERAGINVSRYHASEINARAIQVSKNNYSGIKQLGDVKKVKGGGLYDLLIGGSPCQGFSFQGKMFNFEDPRSKLFFEYARVLKECVKENPDILFLLENVKMKQEFVDIISGILGVQPIAINSALVSAQNRQRLYWTNIQGVKPPKDKGILLKDIIEDGVVDRDKSYCIVANQHKGSDLQTYFRKSRRQIIFKNKAAVHTCCAAIDKHEREGKRYTVGDNPADRLLWRNPTPLECERLQTLPEGYTAGIPAGERYKVIGNGWTIDVITHILSFIPRGIKHDR